MLVEMEQAWIGSDSKSGGQIRRDQAVTDIAEEYFAYGMSIAAINELLADFKERGIQIGERRREGYIK